MGRRNMDFPFALNNPDAFNEEFKRELAGKIYTMLSQNPERFFQSLYRLDVNEAKVREFLKDKALDEACYNIAGLIMNRELEKHRSRQAHIKPLQVQWQNDSPKHINAHFSGLTNDLLQALTQHWSQNLGSAQAQTNKSIPIRVHSDNGHDFFKAWLGELIHLLEQDLLPTSAELSPIDQWTYRAVLHCAQQDNTKRWCLETYQYQFVANQHEISFSLTLK